MLLEKHISENPNAGVIVLFGGSPLRRDDVIRSLKEIPDLSVFGALSEEEGINMLVSLPRVDIVLIGGRYDAVQRKRIRSFIDSRLPHIVVTEPGIDYAYDEKLIVQKVRELLDPL